VTERTDLCPICKKIVSRKGEYFPFCSGRCKTVDLGAWAAEDYVISRPVTEADEHYESLSEETQQDENYE
jgi:endogenous inhibitor of DNA gyrase (YacG/DUF329 family)